MTHEADNTNFAMSLLDDAAEAAFCASVNKAKLPPDHFTATTGKSEQELRMSFGRWSNQDKMEWECGACTFLNQPLFLSCEICGQARPAQQDPPNDEAALHLEAATEEVLTASEILPPDVQRQLLMEEEERVLKQERLREIMALQQGIFNKIREENEEQEIEELEGSFAWMALEDEMKELPRPATSRVSCGHAKDGGGGFGKKPPPMDASSSTVTTAAMSSLGGSSRFSLDWSGNSQHSRISGVSAGRNSAIPDQALASLKEESAQGSYVRGSVSMGSSSIHQQNMPSLQTGYVDFGALRAAVEGVSVRSFPMANDATNDHVGEGDSNHSERASFATIGDSNRSIELSEEEPETPNHTRRRGAMAASLSALDTFVVDGHHHQHQQDQHDEANNEPALPRPNRVGARSVTCSPTSKPPEDENATRQTQSMVDLPGLAPIGAMPMTGSPTSKSRKESHKDRLLTEEDPESPKPESPSPPSEASAPKTLFTGMTRTPKSQENARGDLRGSLHRHEGKLKIPSPSLVPNEKKNVLTSPRDPVFSRNLYADRKREAADKNKNSRSVSPRNKKEKAHSVAFPLINRMLRKKSVAKTDS